MAIGVTGDAPLPGGLAGPIDLLATVPHPPAPDTDTVSNGVSEPSAPPSPAPSSGPASGPAGAPGEGTVVDVTFGPADGDGVAPADDLGVDDLAAISSHAGARGRNDGQDPLGPQGDELPLDLIDFDLETLMGISIGGEETITDVTYGDGGSHGGGAKFGIFDLGSSATVLGAQVTLASFDVNDGGSGSLSPAMNIDLFTDTTADSDTGGGGATGTVTVTVANLIEGGPGDDTLNGTTVEDTIFGYAGYDTISGRNGDDTLYGGDGNDTLNGQGGSDALFGGVGDDILIWDSLDAVIDGGGGTDTLDAGGADIDITGFAGTITGIEVIDLTKPGADTVTLSAEDILDFSDNNTVTVTGGSPDTVEAGTGWTDAGFDGSGNHIYTQDVGGTLATLLLDPDVAANADIIA